MMKYLFFVLLSPLLLISCSRISIAVHWADTFVLSGVEDYFDLSSAQKSQFKTEFKLILKEIEKNDFPKLAEYLESLAATVENNQLTLTVVQDYIKKGGGLIKNAFIKFEPLAIRIVEEQASKGFESFDNEFNEKFNKDLKELDDQNARAKKLKKQYEFWIDQTVDFLQESQEKSLTEQIAENPSPKQLQLQSKKSVYDKFVIARANPIARKEFISKFFNDWESLQTTEYLQARKVYHEKLFVWIYQLSQTLNEKQKRNLTENLRKRSKQILNFTSN
jgi:hypothetical protein